MLFYYILSYFVTFSGNYYLLLYFSVHVTCMHFGGKMHLSWNNWSIIQLNINNPLILSSRNVKHLLLKCVYLLVLYLKYFLVLDKTRHMVRCGHFSLFSDFLNLHDENKTTLFTCNEMYYINKTVLPSEEILYTFIRRHSEISLKCKAEKNTKILKVLLLCDTWEYMSDIPAAGVCKRVFCF